MHRAPLHLPSACQPPVPNGLVHRSTSRGGGKGGSGQPLGSDALMDANGTKYFKENVCTKMDDVYDKNEKLIWDKSMDSG